jgi:hypothetical protein
MLCGQIESVVITAWTPRPVRFWDHVQWRRPWRIGSSYDPSFLQVSELGFRDPVLFRIEAPWLCENWAARGFNGMENTMFWIGRPGPIPDNGGKSGQEGADGRCHVTQRGGQTGAAGGGFGTCDWIQCAGI